MSDLILDISNNNGVVDLDAAKAYGVRGVFVKASEGLSFTDRFLGANRAAAARLRLPFGAYHFLHPNDPIDQAKHFCAIIQKLNPTDFRPVIDCEAPGCTEADARAFSQVVRKMLGAYPIFYSYSDFMRQMNCQHTIGNGLWLADYGANDGEEHPYSVPAPWKKVELHQFTSKAKVPGVIGNADLNYGDRNKLFAHPVQARISLGIK